MKNTIQALFLTTIAFSLQSCISSSGSSGGNQSGDISITASASSINSNLDETTTLTASITSTGYVGDVTIELDRTSLDNATSANSDITITPTSSSITLAEGETKDITVNINVRASAPSFTASEITLIATEEDSGDSSTIDIPITVNPVYEVTLTVDDGGNHSWDQPFTENFRAHTGDLTIRFINTDEDAIHVFHSNNGSLWGHPDPDDVVAGEDYEVTLTSLANAGDPASNIYYCHTHEGIMADGRTMNFSNQL